MTMQITLVTGNKNKLSEWQRILPDNVQIVAHDTDVIEIQSLDPEEIVADKAKRAYEQLQTPVIVEDVSAGLEKLGGLPGPFIKFFFKKMGDNALFTLAGRSGEVAKISCVIAYYDGTKLFTVRGEVTGTVVAPRGSNGFGFDKVFAPDGSDKTYGEMTPDEKNAVSHRSKAIRLFVEKFIENIG